MSGSAKNNRTQIFLLVYSAKNRFGQKSFFFLFLINKARISLLSSKTVNPEFSKALYKIRRKCTL